MTLIKSISGIRGTIGGEPGDSLSPLDLVKFTAAFAKFLKISSTKANPSVVVGRDARVSGEMVNKIVCGTFMSCGFNVTDIGVTTTPTVAIATTKMKADGAVVVTASHNPAQWNALKLLNEKGEFINAEEGNKVIELADNEYFDFVSFDRIGAYEQDSSWMDKHIELILKLPLVDIQAIKKAQYTIVVDAVNSGGGIAIPKLLHALGVARVHELYCTPDGKFPHNPEPLPIHLAELSELVIKMKADLGFAVDPDVDRLAIVDENGEMFGEEYTLVAVADYVMQNEVGNAVSNLSSSRALRDIATKHDRQYFASAVGEVNVVETMKSTDAVIGGEGNGGVIYPALHYGRDALVGIALFLSSLARSGLGCSALRNQYPRYEMVKDRIQLSKDLDIEQLFKEVAKVYQNEQLNTTDGIKIDFEHGWVHLRKSNTEPIVRIYAEANDLQQARELTSKLIVLIGKLTK